MFWVISVYFNIRNTLPKFCPFLLGHPVYLVHTHTCFFIHACTYAYIHTCMHRPTYRLLNAVVVQIKRKIGRLELSLRLSSKYNKYIPRLWHTSQLQRTLLYAVIVGCNSCIFELTRSINSKRQYLDFAVIAFIERYTV